MQPSTAGSIPVDQLQLSDMDDPRLVQATQLYNSGNPGLAVDLLDSIDATSLSAEQKSLKRILLANILLHAGGGYQASQVLRAPLESRDPETTAVYYFTRARASLMLGHSLDALINLNARDRYLSGESRLKNQLLIWDVLLIADEPELLKIHQSASTSELQGWAALARAYRNAPPASLSGVVNNWRIDHVGHPASPEFLDRISAATATSSRPRKIAFLLPISSNYEPAANAIREGFEVMNNDQPGADRFQVSFYDYGRTPSSVSLYYTQAVNDGADVIVGPLGRNSVATLISSAEMTVPTILLSPADQHGHGENLLQFSLSQELEARQAAERAWLDGHRRGVIMYPQTSIGQRMAAAFSGRFTELGGELLSTIDYARGSTDFSSPVQRLLDIDKSEQRISEIQATLGEKVVTEPRRRQDIDFIFLPASNKDARLIKPVLDFYFALDLPVYSTSRIFSGKADAINDTDLERIRFPDMPWMIATNVEIESMRTFLQGAWPNRDTGYNRLYALGMDLFSVIPKLERMTNNPYIYYKGLSGVLNLDRNGNMIRQLLWARIRKGTPQLLDRHTDYQGRFSEKKYKALPAITPAARQ